MLQCCATCFDMPLSLYKLSKTYHEWYSWKLGTSFCGFKSTSPFPHCPFTCYEMLSMTRQCSVHKSVGTHAFIYASKLAQVFRFQGAADVAPAILDGGISWSKIRGFPQGRNFPHICSPKETAWWAWYAQWTVFSLQTFVSDRLNGLAWACMGWNHWYLLLSVVLWELALTLCSLESQSRQTSPYALVHIWDEKQCTS